MRSLLLLCSFLTGHLIAHSQILVKDINPEPTIGSVTDKFNMVELNGKAYFNADDGVHAMELWVTDGTEAGTQLVKDINTTASFGGVNFDGVFEQWTPVALNGKIYFPASGTGTGIELWVSDGTEEGTQLLHDIRTIEPNSSYTGGHNYNNFFVHGGYIWFSAVDNDFYTGLWRTDGTSAGTTLVKQIISGNIDMSSLTAFDGKVWFVCNNGLWSSDGTEIGTQLIQSFQSITYGRPNELVVFDNELYFAADNGSQGKELCKINSQGDLGVLDVIPGADGVIPRQMVVYNDKIYFVGYDSVHSDELWMSDGTIAGTEMVTEINPNGNSYINFPQAAYEPLFIYNDELWFSAWDDAHGRELWHSDGTAAGTERYTDLTDANAGSTPSKFVIHDNKLFFSANYQSEGRQLHSYDATNDELNTYWQDGDNDLACCTGKMFSTAGELYMPGNYDFNDVIRDELYKLGSTPSTILINHHTSSVQAFPSPTKGEVRITTQGLELPLHAKIMNTSGQLCDEFLVTSKDQSINIYSLSHGLYNIVIKDSAGKYQLLRLVKE